MREIITATASETIDDGAAVHIDASGDAYSAVLPDKPATGVCIIGAASTESIQVIVSGRIESPIEGQAGLVVYLDNETPGGITWSAPSGAAQTLGRLSDGGIMVVQVDQQQISVNPAAASFFL